VTLRAVDYATAPRRPSPPLAVHPAPKRDLVGVDVYVEWLSKKPNDLAALIGKASDDGLKL
jgi:hypothetical protein